MKKLIWPTIVVFLCNLPFSFAQDPFFTHFYGNKSFFNPSLVGLVGSTSIGARYKSQWRHNGNPAFRTVAVSYEESLPCSFFDYGLFATMDEEGTSNFKTYDVGFRIAGTPALKTFNTVHNLRIGMDFRWVWKTIDFSTLIFSDQLDPKYGTVDVNGVANPTAFTPPFDQQSTTAFAPAVGLTYKVLFDESDIQSPSLMVGASYHNTLSIGNRDSGHEDSVLGLGGTVPTRWNAFAEFEWIPFYKNKVFLLIRPSLFYQKQGPLDYWEAGVQFWRNRLISVGGYYHANSRSEVSNNAEWLSFRVETGALGGENGRVNLGFTYATNFKGLRNFVGPTLEFSVTYHFAASPSCNLAGLENEVPYGNPKNVKCPTGVGARSKLYEDIWFDENWRPNGKFKR
ncbi:MAG: type IX secretion system membrane protein PorP/SprF [Bacteroidota bacterium]